MILFMRPGQSNIKAVGYCRAKILGADQLQYAGIQGKNTLNYPKDSFKQLKNWIQQNLGDRPYKIISKRCTEV